MISPASLIERFARAGLTLDLPREPFAGRAHGLADIVQLDIRKRGTREHYILWPGADRNRIEVEGIDRQRAQLVLMVDEPERVFAVEISLRAKVDERLIVKRQGNRRWVRQRTAGVKRHFLLGRDESHLFIAQLPKGVSSVHGAHALLKGAHVRAAEASAGTEALRQGEWFFIRQPRAVQVELDATPQNSRLIKRYHDIGLAQAAGVSRPGRAHLAEEVRRVDSLTKGVPAGTYLRGSVRHPDHATLTFREWHLVLGNTEARAAVVGLSWVD